MPPELSRAARRITVALFSAQALGSAGFIASATVAAIVGAELSGREALAGIPSGVFMIGAAGAALLWGTLMEVLGRRASLTLGLFTGATGAVVAAHAVVLGSFLQLVIGLFIMGSAHAALQLSRFVAAEVNPPERRGRAVASVVIGGTVGAVLGPLLVAPGGSWALSLGLPELTGPYIVALALFALAGICMVTFLRPDPRRVAAAVEASLPQGGSSGSTPRSSRVIFSQTGVVTAVSTMVVAQAVMVMLMVMTALHMTHHDHSLAGVSVVFSSHTLGMFAFSIVSGQLTDRWGRVPVILSGATIMILSSLSAPLSPHLVPLSVALFGLGLGWNLCFVGGSSLLSDQLRTPERGRVQGLNDLLIGLASAAASLLSGITFAWLGYAFMGVAGALLTLIPLFLVARWGVRLRNRHAHS